MSSKGYLARDSKDYQGLANKSFNFNAFGRWQKPFMTEDCSFILSVFIKLVRRINIENFASDDRGGLTLAPPYFPALLG